MTLNPQKSPGRCRGLSSRRGGKSITRCHRSAVAAEAIVKSHRDHVHVLSDPVIEYGRKTRIDHGEGVVRIAHEQMVVFNPHRPVRGETILPADAQCAAPTRAACRDQIDPSDIVEYVEAVASHGRTALDIEQ